MVAAVAGGARAVARCDALGVPPYSDTPDGLFRGWLGPAFLAAREAVAGWMTEAGMTVSIDAATNLIGRYAGSDPDAPVLLIGSHLDSVRDAGRYDGPLGIMLGIECVAALHAAGRRLRFGVEVIAFGDEEGSRFPAAMLTSRAVAGRFDPATLALADGEGITVAEALQGADPAVAARAGGSVLAYLEAHIEQGPALDREGLALAAVTGIAAQLRYRVTIEGWAGHAGTTAMPLRRDALAAAAEAILAVERVGSAGPADLVATVGRIDVAPGAANVIPGWATMTLDVRALDAAVRDRAAAEILADLAALAARRGVGVQAEVVHDLAASPCDAALVERLAAAMAAAGHPPRRLVSGAGHDAMIMAALCPTAMLFVRCRDGISHNPAEHVDPADAHAALQVMLGFIDTLESDA